MKDVGEPGDREGHARIDGGWLETDAKVMVAEMGASLETPGMSAGTYCRTAPRQPPTLLRWGNSARKFSQIDDYVRERLALFDSKKRQRSGRRWEEVHSKAWFAGLRVSRLSGTVRYIQSATART